ncbi:SulP family inorganic anion transporter [Diaphorobacter ruginosibacter]|uniref:SulP family inorganic anion transporter n=1 Tax=Diaphorobacter ruginosibacter TaxID=1715720 RepID=A0A7G9RIE3_9BURK|nr:SulP family inorganic anion transporter [Diaphorobacter ruginosibacter]QNN55368.1 SulP family inorganic anion transporter [Diaphorobacter ruginosibacter]
MNLHTMRHWLPFLNWPRPTKALLKGEFIAGMTVGLMLVPQGVAYAALAGMPLVTGIYASLIPAIVAVLFSSSTRLGVGPTALTSLLIGASLTGMAEPGSAHWVSLAVWLAILSGLLQAFVGVVRFGWLLSLVTSPILTGFTQAAALLILLSQLPALLGLRTSWHALFSNPSIHHFDFRSLAFGVGSLVLLTLSKRLRPTFPGAIVVISGAALVSWLTGFADRGGDVIGHLPSGFPSLYLPQWLTWDEFGALLMPTMVVALVSFLETASSAKIEHQREGTQWNENQDLIAQGLAKISSGLTGGFATSASFSRSALNLYAGAQTGWSNLFATGLVLVALLWLMPELYHVPDAVLAAVVVTAVTGLFKPREMLRLWQVSRVEASIGLATFALTIATAPRIYWGVLAGVVANLCLFIYQRMHPRIIEVGLHPDGSLRDRRLWQLPPLAPGLLAVRMDAELDFASAASLERRITSELQSRADIRDVCIFASSINRIDITGVETFQRLRWHLKKTGGTLTLSGLKLPVEQRLSRADALGEDPHLRLYRTDTETLASLQSRPEG